MKKTTIITYLAWTMAAAAHPGHDAALPADSVAHWLFSPLHGLGVVALAAVIAMVWYLRGKGDGHE